MEDNIKISIPEFPVKQGFFKLFREMFSELKKSRELIFRFFIRDFRARYKQSLLGIAWIIIMPVSFIGVFILMNKSGIINIGEIDVPYPVFALTGLTIWQLFATGLIGTTNSIISAGSIVIKINFPKETLVFSSLAQAFFDFLIRMFLVALVFIFYKVSPSWQALFFPIFFIPLIILTLGIGLLLSLLNCISRDITNVVGLVTTFLLFLTPILYQKPAVKLFENISRYNILVPLVTGPRDLILYGRITNPAAYIGATVISLLVFLFSWRIFHLAEYKMTEVI
ncbi:MAG: ABC transporter permease [Candidatus Omnitrophica bacterium]|nr:ABC transporter permease [Candidatus Omnitrophota bacterium]